MTKIEAKTEELFQKFSLQIPKVSRHLVHIYADFVELIALFSNEDETTPSMVLDRFSDEEAEVIPEEEIQEIEDSTISSDDYGSSKSIFNDRREAWISNVFAILDDRKKLFKEDYPFELQNNCIKLKSSLSEKHKLYIHLLTSSNLNHFIKVKTELTNDFETITYLALKNFLPPKAQVKQFGKNTEYKGNAKNKITKLAKDLNIAVNDYELNQIPAQNTQERGLDLVAWIPFEDSCSNTIVLLGQCACGKEWYTKLSETRRYESYFYFYKIKPYHLLFVPYALINSNENKFYQSDEIAGEYLLFERKRILEHISDISFIENLNAKCFVDKCIEYKQDIV